MTSIVADRTVKEVVREAVARETVMVYVAEEQIVKEGK